jgi:hypothetical protein
MMIGQRHKSQCLLYLIDTVRGYNPRVFIEISGKPEDKAYDK